MTEQIVGRSIGCWHNFALGPCGGCGAVALNPDDKWDGKLKSKTDADDFRREMIGEWIEDTKPLYDLAAEYHKRCDEFDIKCCGNEYGRPTNGAESRMVNNHGRSVLKELQERQTKSGIKGDLLKEIRRQAR